MPVFEKDVANTKVDVANTRVDVAEPDKSILRPASSAGRCCPILDTYKRSRAGVQDVLVIPPDSLDNMD